MRLKVAPEDISDLDISDWIARLRDEPGIDEAAGAAPDEDGAEPGDHAAAELGDDATDGPTDDAVAGPWAAAEPGDVAAAGPGDDAAAEPGDDAAAGPGNDAAAGPGDDAAAGPGNDAAAGPGNDAAAGPGNDAAAEPGDVAAGAPRQAPAGPSERAAIVARRARPQDRVRAVIGNEIRIPAVWCELAPCISRYSDSAALGEADIRARALWAGWRADGLGRLTCPQCQQSSPLFWSAHPVALWDKEAALITVARMAAGRRESRAGRDAGTAESGVLPPVQAAITVPGRHEIRGRHRKYSQRSPANVPGGEDIAALPVTVT